MSTIFKSVKDNARSTTTGLNNTTNPVTFSVATGEGARFPSSGAFWVTAWSGSDPEADANMEILLVASRSGDSLQSAARGQVNTSNVAHSGTVNVRLMMLAQHLDDITTQINNLQTAKVVTLQAESVYDNEGNLGGLADQSIVKVGVSGGLATLAASTAGTNHMAPVNCLGLIPNARLSATTNNAYPDADVANATVVYYTPLASTSGSEFYILLYDGSAWKLHSSQQISTGTLSGLTSNTTYNVYIYDNSGTLTLELSTTGTVEQDGILVKSGATSRRYIGMVRATSTTQTQDTETQRFVSNYYNRVYRKLYIESSSGFSTTSTSYVEDTNLGDLAWLNHAGDLSLFFAWGTLSTTTTNLMTTSLVIGDGGTTQVSEYTAKIRANGTIAVYEAYHIQDLQHISTTGLVSRNVLVKVSAGTGLNEAAGNDIARVHFDAKGLSGMVLV